MKKTTITGVKRFSLLALLGVGLWAGVLPVQAQVGLTLRGPKQAASCGQVLVTNRFVNNGQTVANLWITNELPSSSYAYVPLLSTVTLPDGTVLTGLDAEPAVNNGSTNLVWDFSAVVTPSVVTNLLITEVFYNTGLVPDPDNEWVEIYNPTPDPVNVTGWWIQDTSPGVSNALPSFTIAAGEFVIIAARTNAFLAANVGYPGQVVEVASGLIGSGLNNFGDGVILRNATGGKVDAVSYGASTGAFSPSVPNVAAGISIVRNPANSDTGTRNDWGPSSPTPGTGILPVGIQKGGVIELVYAVEIGCGAAGGQLFSRTGFEQPPGTPKTAQVSTFLTVNTPDLVVTKNPIMQSAGVGDTVTWTVRVGNAGFGPAANVVAVDTIGPGFSFTGFGIEPTTSTATNAMWDSTKIAAFTNLAPGAYVDIVVTATVERCDGLYNQADAQWGCSSEQVCENTRLNDQTATAGIQFIQRYPNVTVSLSPDPLTVDYCAGGEVTLMVTNTAGPGVGRVADFKFISTVPTGWTVTGPNVDINGEIQIGQLMPGTGTNITVQVMAGGACPIALTPQGIYFKPDYFDFCGNRYSGPLLAELATVSNKPGASVTKIIDSTLSGVGTFPVRVELAYTNFSGNESITLTDVYPFSTHTNLTVANISSGGTQTSTSIVWTAGSLSGTGVATYSFDIVIAEPCGGPVGLDYNVLHATPFEDCKGCDQAVEGDGFRYPVRFQQSGCPGTGGCSFVSTKDVSANLTEVCDPVTVTHTFSAISGTNIANWNGVTFTANLAGGDGVLPSTNDVAVFVDGTNYISNVSITGESPALTLNLSGLNSSLSPSPTNMTSLEITYKVNVSAPGQYSDHSSLTIPGCGSEGDDVFWNVGESRMEIDLEQIFIAEACGRVPGSIDLRMIPSPEGVSGTNALFPAYDVVVTLDMDFDGADGAGFSYIPGTTTFSNIYDQTTGDPIAPTNPGISGNQLTWTLGDLRASTNMSIHYLLRPSCGQDFTGLRRAEVRYNNRCEDGTAPALLIAVSQTNVEPYFVQANLINTLQPQVQFLTDTQIVNQIRILNTGDPYAYNLYIEMDLPPGVSFAGAGIPPTSITPSKVIWDLHTSLFHDPALPLDDDDGDSSFDDLRPRQELAFWVTNNLDYCTADNYLVIRSSHGCKTEQCSWAPDSTAAFVRISGSLVTRATFPAQNALCGVNPVEYSIRNSGLTVDYDVKAFQTLPDGMTYVPGSGGVSIDGGTINFLADPSASGTLWDPLTWTSTEIPELAKMLPNEEVTISYNVQLGCQLVTGDRQFVAEGQFTDLCGNVVNNREVVTVLEPDVPLLVVDKSANVEAANLDQEVVYTVTISHDPESDADVPYLMLTDVLPASVSFLGASVAPDSFSGQTLIWSSTNLIAQTVDATAPFKKGTETITILVTGKVTACEGSVINTAVLNYGCSETDACLSADAEAIIITVPRLVPPGLVGTLDLTTCSGTKTVTITNSGATANQVILTEYAPPGYIFTGASSSGEFTSANLIFQPSGTPGGSIATVDFSTATSSGATDANDDIGDGPNLLDLGKNRAFTVTWTLASTGENLDCLADPTDLDYLDPEQGAPTLLTFSNKVDYSSLCGESYSVAGNISAYPGIPDLDIDLQPNSQIVTNGEVVNFTLSVINRSETTDAEGIYVRVKMGTGWTNLTYVSSNIVSSTTSNMLMEVQGNTNLLFDFPGVILNPLNDKIEVVFTAMATTNGGYLDAYAEVVGDCGIAGMTPSCTFTNTLGWPAFADTMGATLPGMTGPVNGQYYSFDQDRFVAAGHTLSKTVRYDEELDTAAGTNRDARVGEDLIYQIKALYFGGAFSNVTVRDTLPAELGFGTPTGYAFTGDITGATWDPNTGIFTLVPSVITNPSSFAVDIPVVVSNDWIVQDGVVIENIALTHFTLDGVTNTPSERTTEVEVYEPVLQITKTVNASGVQEGDIIIFTNRLVHTAASRTSAYSVVFTDTLPAGLVFHDFISPGSGDALVGGTTVSFNSTHWAALSEFKTDDAPIDFVFSVLVTNQIVGVTMTNRSKATYVSLDNLSTNGNERYGSDGPDKELNNYTTTSQVAVTTRAIGGLTKTYVSSSQTNTLTNGTTNDWTIGERFIYEIKVDVPQGVVSNLVLRDTVPAGIDWVGTNANAGLTYPGRGYEFFIPPGGPQFPTNIADGLVIEDADPTPADSTTADGSGQPVVFRLGTFTNAVDGYFTLKLEFVALNLPLNVGTNPTPRRGSNVVTAVDAVTTLGATGPVYRIVEHDIRVRKTRDLPTPDAGDLMTFSVVVSNQPSALANAYDVRAVDFLSSNVYDFTTFTLGAVTPGWVANLIGVPGGRQYVLTSVADTALPPGTGATGVFRVALAQGVRPNQIYTNQVNVTDSTTLYGPPPGGIVERNDGATNSVNFRVPGLKLAKELEGTSETTSPPDSTGSNVQIGETVTYRLAITLPESTITNLTLVDRISANGLAYIYESARLDTNGFEGFAGDFTESPTAPAPAFSMMGQQMTFSFTNVVVSGDNDTNNNTFYMLMDYLVLDHAANDWLLPTVHTNQATLTYGSNPGGVVTSEVVTTTLIEPNLTITKEITPNIGDAGDNVDVTLVVSNNGTATAYDLEITDWLDPAFFSIVTLTNVTLPTGLVHQVVGNTFWVLSDTNTATGTNTLEVGESFTITFRIKVAPSVSPNTLVTNNAVFRGDTLAGTNIYEVQRDYAVTNGATLKISDFCSTCKKILYATSETRLVDSPDGNETNGVAQIGEVLTFQISTRLPETTIPYLEITDHLPEGLAYVVGSELLITNEFNGTLGAMVVTPTTPPLGGSGEEIVFTFEGDTIVTDDSEPTNNIIRIRFNAVVLDLPGNVGLIPQTVLTNNSSITYTNNPGLPVYSSDVIVTLIEPKVDITKTVSPDSGDAGDTVTVTLVATNSGLATAYDLDLSDLLDGTIFDSATVLEGATPLGFVFAQTPSGTDRLVTYLSDTNSSQPTNTLEVGESLVFTFTVNLAQAVEPGAIYTNSATLRSDTIYTTNYVGIQREYTNAAQDTLSISNMVIAKKLIDTSEGTIPADSTGSDVQIGERATYQLTVTLPEATITNLTVTDIIPAGMAYVPLSYSDDRTGFSGSLPPGEPDITTMGGSGDPVTFTFQGLTVVTDDNEPTNNSFTLTFDLLTLNEPGNTGTVAGAQTVLPNSATISYDGNPPVHTSEVVIVTVVEPMLKITKTMGAVSNNVVVIDLVVTNSGLSTAFDVVIEDVLPTTWWDTDSIAQVAIPEGFVFSFTGNPSDATIRIASDTNSVQPTNSIEVGESLLFQFQAMLIDGASSPVTNTVVVTNYTSIDGTNTNERSYDPVEDEDELEIPSYSLTKVLTSPMGRPALVGEVVKFDLIVTNTGPIGLDPVALSDTYDTNYLSFLSATLAPEAPVIPGTLNWTNVGLLAAGQSVTVAVEFEATASTLLVGPTTNWVVAAPSTTNNLPLPPKTNEAPVEVVYVGYTLNKVVTSPTNRPALVGEEITFDITILNTGEVALVEVPLVDTFDAATLSFTNATPAPDSTSATTLTWTNLGSLATGATHTVTVAFTALASTQPGTETNTVTTAPTVPPFYPEVPPLTNEVPYEIIRSSYVLTKTLMDPTNRPAQVGEQVVFALTVMNTGEVPILTVPLVDTFDAATLSFTNATPAPDSTTTNTLTWNDLGSLATGATHTVTVTFNAIASTEGVSDTNGVVTTPTPPPFYPPLPPQTNEVPYDVVTSGYTLAKVVTSQTNRPALVGEAINFDILITNTGEVQLVTVPVTDTYESAYLTFVSASDSGNGTVPGTIDWLDVGPIEAGSNKVLSVSFIALLSTQPGTETNTVTTAPTVPLDYPPVPPLTNEVPYEIISRGYVLTKTLVDPTNRPALVGEQVVFALTVVNTGEVEIPTVPLVDTFDAATLSFASALPTAPDSTTATTLTWNDLGTLATGATHTVTVTFNAIASTEGVSDTNRAVTTPTPPPFYPPLPPQTNEVPYDVVSSGYTLEKLLTSQTNRPALVGEAITFDILITNTGEVQLVEVPLVDTFDSNTLSFASAVPMPNSTTTTTLTWNDLGSLATGATHTVAVTFAAIASTQPGTETNTVATAPTVPPTYPPVPPLTNDVPYEIMSVVAVGDQVWIDENGNGLQDPAETNGVPGVVVVLHGTNGVAIATNITDAAGKYLFTDLVPGDYYVIFDLTTLPPGYVVTLQGDGSAPALDSDANVGTGQTGSTGWLAAGESDLTLDMGIYTVASLGDFVWLDTNGDGIQDGSEVGVSNVVVTLYNATNGVMGVTTTDVAGAYAFTDLVPGDYSVGFAPPAGYAFTLQNQGTNNAANSDADPVTGRTATIPLASGDNDLTWDAGLYEPASLGDYVWEDLNGDGIQDVGEPGIAGVTVELYDAATNLVRTTVTDGLGAYAFTGLIPGEYTVVFVRPSGYHFTLQDQSGDTVDSDADPTTGQTATITLVSGQNDPNWDAGLYRPASVGDYVWLDENWDGVQDPGEAGIPNVRIIITNAIGTYSNSTITDLDGRYLFTDLPPGDYTVRVDTSIMDPRLAANRTYDLDGVPDDQTTVTLASGDEDLRLDFGYNWNADDVVLGSLGDRIWVDANADGVQDSGEPGIPNVTVNLYVDTAGNGSYTTLVATTTTDAAGLYIFPDLPADAYVVRVDTTTLPPGYVQTGDPDHFGTNATANPSQAGDNQTTTPVVLAPGDVFVNADFGYLPPAFSNLGDLIYFDANADGVFNPADGDSAIPGVTVVLLNSNGFVIASTITTGDASATNNYLFTGLPAGDYTVWVNDTANILNGLVQTGDPDGGFDSRSTATLDGQNDDLLQDHGYTPDGHTSVLGLIGDTIFLDRDGDGLPGPGEGIEGVTVRLYDYAGLVLLATTTTDANGNYWFGGLPEDTYVVRVDTTTLPNGGVGLVNTVDPDTAYPGDSISVVAIDPGGINLLQDFGYVAAVPNTIGGTLWRDCNADGTLDLDEDPRWEGVKIVLRDANTNIVGSMLTDTNGDYSFTGLPDGTYTVDVVDVANRMNGFWHSLGPNAGDDNNSQVDPYEVSVGPANRIDTTGDFGYYLSIAELGDYVWYDINGNGLQDGGEPGLSGVRVSLHIEYPDGSEINMETYTDTHGRYRFANLLVDERYRASTTNDPAVVLLPRFTVSIVTTQSTLQADGYDPTTVDAGNGTNDSRNVTGVFAQLAKCGRPVVYDFGFKGGPLLAVIGNVDAFTRDGQTIVRWETIDSWGTAGFWLDRLVDDQWVRISPEMLPYPLFGVAPIVYEEVDPDAVSGGTYVYRLVEMENDGNLLTYGPYTLTVDGAGRTYADWAAEHFTGEELAKLAISGEDADPDGDGLTNWQEFLAGTDPKDANPVLQITAVRQTADGLELKWKSMAGQTYKIAMATSVAGPYLPLEDTVVATGATGVVILPVDADERQLFFNVILVLNKTSD